MSFSQFTDMPSLGSYKRALDHYNSITPIRGRTEDVRPLCNTTTGRRKTHLRILPTTYDGLPAMACRLYNTDVVIYVSDGRVVIDNDYPSQSTNSFASALTPFGMVLGRRYNETWVWCRGQAYWLPVRAKLEMEQPDNGIGWYPVEPHTFYKHVANRKVLSAFTKQYKPFGDHCMNIVKLLGANAQANTEYVRTPDAQVLRDASREGWGEATKYFLKQAEVTTWTYGYKSRITKLVPAKLKKALLDYVKVEHNEEIFEKEAAPIGVTVNDINCKYIGASN
jgi:hypothetical protein